MKEFDFLNATNEQKSAAFEWLREEALRRHNRRWYNAAILMEEVKRLVMARRALEQIVAGDVSGGEYHGTFSGS